MPYLANKMQRLKPYLSFLLIILLFLSFGIVTIKGLFTLGHLTRTIYEHPLVVSNASLHAALNITKMHRSMKDVVLAVSPDEIEATLKDIDEAEQKVFQQLDIIRKDILGEEGTIIEEQTRKLFMEWRPIREEVVHLLESGDKQNAILITKGKGAHHVARLEGKMLELTSYARGKATGFLTFAESSQARLEKITIFLTVAGVCVSLAIACLATRRLKKASKKIVDKNRELQNVLDEITILRGIIPICSYCKKIRDDKGAWEMLEAYIGTHSEAQFTHGVCPDCYNEQIELLNQE